MVCGFTGHRPHKLPWGNREDDPRCQAVKVILSRRLEEAYEMGCRKFLCGMARGCDLYFAEAVLKLRAAKPDVQLYALIPCPQQAERWSKGEKERYAYLCTQCDHCEILEQVYTPGCMLRRNREMLLRSQVLISIYDGSSGGTGSTVSLAKKRGLTILPVWI